MHTDILLILFENYLSSNKIKQFLSWRVNTSNFYHLHAGFTDLLVRVK